VNKSQNCDIFITTCNRDSVLNWSFCCNWRSTRNYI